MFTAVQISCSKLVQPSLGFLGFRGAWETLHHFREILPRLFGLLVVYEVRSEIEPLLGLFPLLRGQLRRLWRFLPFSVGSVSRLGIGLRGEIGSLESGRGCVFGRLRRRRKLVLDLRERMMTDKLFAFTLNEHVVVSSLGPVGAVG